MAKQLLYTTITGAAQILELNRETIKNYIKRGLIRTIGSGHNLRLLIRDVEKLAECGSVRDVDRNIRRYLKVAKREEKKAFEQYFKDVYESRNGLHTCNLYARKFLDTILDNLNKPKKDLEILYDVLHGISFADIAQREKCSPENVRYKFREILNELNDFLIDGASCKAELEDTKKKLYRAKEYIRILKEDNKSCVNENNWEILLNETNAFFYRKLKTRDLAMFQRNGITKVADLVDYSEKELLSLGITEECLGSIKSILAPYGIHFRRNSSHMVTIYTKELKDLNLSVRTKNCLSSIGVNTIGQLVATPRNTILEIRSFGKKCIDEVDTLLGLYNLKLT